MDNEPNIFKARIQDYQKVFDPETITALRKKNTAKLRRSNRADIISKRRKTVITEKLPELNDDNLTHLKEDNSDYQTKNNETISFVELVEAMKSHSDQKILFAAEGFRKLSSSKDPPIHKIIDSGVLLYIFRWINRHDAPRLQYECAWIVTNITSGDQTDCDIIVNRGFLPILVSLLESQDKLVREQAMWALGNISANSVQHRDLLIKQKGFDSIIKCLESDSGADIIHYGLWTISNICRLKPLPSFAAVSSGVRFLIEAISFYSSSNKGKEIETLKDSLWAVSKLVELDDIVIESLIKSDVIRKIISLLTSDTPEIQLPALILIGNVLTRSFYFTSVAISFSAVEVLGKLIDSDRPSIQKSATWAVSNICAGSQKQLDRVLRSNIIPKLIKAACNCTQGLKKEIAFTLSNSIASGSRNQILSLVEVGVIQALCKLIQENDTEIILIALEGLNLLLRLQEKSDTTENEFTSIIEECGGLSIIENLQLHDNPFVFEAARGLIENYFEIEPCGDLLVIERLKLLIN